MSFRWAADHRETASGMVSGAVWLKTMKPFPTYFCKRCNRNVSVAPGQKVPVCHRVKRDEWSRWCVAPPSSADSRFNTMIRFVASSVARETLRKV